MNPIFLESVEYDPFARGYNCQLPYPNHPKGCPNFPKCIKKRPDFRTIAMSYKWFAVIEEFDLKRHAEKMKTKLPHWSDRQCRNLMYWQGGVRSRLLKKAKSIADNNPESIILDIPEACGVEVFKTMAKVGIILERKPDTVRKVMIVGIKISTPIFLEIEQ